LSSPLSFSGRPPLMTLPKAVQQYACAHTTHTQHTQTCMHTDAYFLFLLYFLEILISFQQIFYFVVVFPLSSILETACIDSWKPILKFSRILHIGH
jgi:hypothetical protein